MDVTEILQATKARDHRIFTGRLARKHPSFPDRAMASTSRAQEGDFRNWPETRAWATSIADTLLSDPRFRRPSHTPELADLSVQAVLRPN